MIPSFILGFYRIFTMGREEHTPKLTNTTTSSLFFTSARGIDNMNSLCYASNFDLLKRTAAENGPFSNKTCSTSYSGPSNDAQVKWFVLQNGWTILLLQ